MLVLAGAVAIAVAFTFTVPTSVVGDYTSECQNPTQTYTAANMPTSLNLVSTDRVLFESGTFTGSVNNQGAVICIAGPATYSPANINGTSRLFVRGVANLPSLAAGSGAELDNEGTVTFLGSINTNGTATVINRATGTIVVLTPGFALGPAAVVTNLGTVDIRGALNLNGSTVTNQGLITAVGPLTMSGSLTNAGRLAVANTVTVNSNSTLANSCRLESTGLINNSTTSNAGVIALGSGALLNNGGAVLSQTSTAIAVGGNFTNNGSVSGAGQYLFTGTTITQGSFVGASAADPIVFYDTTQSAGQIFDTQTGTVTNTIRQVVTPPDSSACSVSPPTPTTTTTSSTTTTSTTTTTSSTTTTTSSTTTTTSSTTTTTSSTTTTTTTTEPPTTTTTTEPPTTTTTTEPPTTTTTEPPTTTTTTEPPTTTSTVAPAPTDPTTTTSTVAPVPTEPSTSTTATVSPADSSTTEPVISQLPAPPTTTVAPPATGGQSGGAGDTLPPTGGRSPARSLVIVALSTITGTVLVFTTRRPRSRR